MSTTRSASSGDAVRVADVRDRHGREAGGDPVEQREPRRSDASAARPRTRAARPARRRPGACAGSRRGSSRTRAAARRARRRPSRAPTCRRARDGCPGSPAAAAAGRRAAAGCGPTRATAIVEASENWPASSMTSRSSEPRGTRVGVREVPRGAADDVPGWPRGRRRTDAGRPSWPGPCSRGRARRRDASFGALPTSSGSSPAPTTRVEHVLDDGVRLGDDADAASRARRRARAMTCEAT